jgi:hypothetical protein
MASPLSRNLIAGAIGESGGMIKPTLAPVPLADGEQNGLGACRTYFLLRNFKNRPGIFFSDIIR